MKKMNCNLFTLEVLTSPYELVYTCREFQIENWNLEVLVLEEMVKTKYPEKYLSEQGREPTTNQSQPTDGFDGHRGFNPGHIYW